MLLRRKLQIIISVLFLAATLCIGFLYQLLNEGAGSVRLLGAVIVSSFFLLLFISFWILWRSIRPLEEITARDEAILAGIGDGVFAFNAQRRIVLFNDAAATISGWSSEEVIDRPYDGFLQFVQEETGQPNDGFIMESLATGQVKQMPPHTMLVTKLGRKIPVADSAAPVHNQAGQIIGGVVIFRDVTKERAIDEAKNEFVSLASHQLRTPLTPIKLFSEMLLNEEVGPLTIKQREYLEQMAHSTERMIFLINDLLNVSRLETGRLKVEPQPIKLQPFIQDIIQEVQQWAEAHNCGIRLISEAATAPSIPLDPTLIRQVIHNLLTNAIRYSPAKKCGIVVHIDEHYGSRRKKTALRLRPGATQPGITAEQYVVISVQDEGIGIPPEAQGRIFEKFFRADNAQKAAADGSGLGLYMAKMIMEAAAGKIWFQSVAGKGTTFYVAIPRAGMSKKEGERSLAQ